MNYERGEATQRLIQYGEALRGGVGGVVGGAGGIHAFRDTEAARAIGNGGPRLLDAIDVLHSDVSDAIDAANLLRDRLGKAVLRPALASPAESAVSLPAEALAASCAVYQVRGVGVLVAQLREALNDIHNRLELE